VAETAGKHRQTFETLYANQLGFGARTRALFLRFAHGAAHSAGKTRGILFEDVIGRAFAQCFNGRLFTQRGRDVDKRNVHALVAQQLQRALT